MMTDEERKLLLGTAKHLVELSDDRNDMLVGIMAAIVDLYRVSFAAGRDTKSAALVRLDVEHQELQRLVGGIGCKALKWLIDSLKNEKLDAAKLLREPPVGSA
jgi:hypothetical protein